MRPIGIFDSGIGGLTVARAVAEVLPAHSIIYYGDTAHLPYGEKSPALIGRYATEITRELVRLGCGSIVVACNSASSNALDVIRAEAGESIPVIDVVHPVVEAVSAQFPAGQIGVIGTRATIDSGWYQSLLASRGFEVVPKATPLLASAIEAGFHVGEVSDALISAYFESGEFNAVRALILGCTHYPLVADQIAEALPESVKLLDSAEAAAQALKVALQPFSEDGEMSATGRRFDRFMVSDLTVSFSLSAQRFFGQPVDLVEHKLPSVTG
ncbi:MAG: glutamate racemase [Crocinitomicaceae bacterium]|nr:glutamate racemase [Crocinitomicaceae bacterium]